MRATGRLPKVNLVAQRRRARLIQMWNSGKSVEEISRTLGYADKSVEALVTKLRQDGHTLVYRGHVRSQRRKPTVESGTAQKVLAERMLMRSNTKAIIMDAHGTVIGELISDGSKRTRVMKDGRATVQADRVDIANEEE